MNSHRRRVLRSGLAAGSLFLPLPYARVWAQSEGTMKLLRLPKIALVVGNSKYKESPLKNPANDAKAIGEALKGAGFAVTSRLDAGKAEMAAAVDAYTKELAAKKCVGLFYYAGHGIQLAWRNYMLPVDADIDTLADIQKQGVEVNSLMEGIGKAGNPMNLVILDACRDNPFGNLKGVDHKGLSQMDAPQATLLAYATSPGNTASDGSGANGLYTENLLREIKVPEAKVEDVFKRVRLGVRLKSKGAQIPWESTSLEDDFWFIPPAELKKLSDAERDKRFREQLAIWQRIEGSTDPAALEDFLRSHPNGDFAELAQARLDQVLKRLGEKKIEIASQEGNPFTQGSASANTDYKVGDSYTYNSLDAISKVVKETYTATVTKITDTEIIYDDGRFVTDLLGNTRRGRDGQTFTANQVYPAEFSVGKRWETRFILTNPRRGTTNRDFEWRIVAKERITVPAGTFDTFRAEGAGGGLTPQGRTMTRTTKIWFAPALVRRPIAEETIAQVAGRTWEAERSELVSFKQS